MTEPTSRIESISSQAESGADPSPGGRKPKSRPKIKLAVNDIEISETDEPDDLDKHELDALA